MAQLMFPDVAGSFQQGFQNGQNMQFNRLAGAAMQNPDQRAQLLGQAGAINPGAALQIQGVYAQQAEQQQAAQQAQQADAMKKIGGAARYMLSALQTKDPNQIEGAYQAVRPYLAELGQAQGKTPPPNWDPSMVPAIYQAAAATASAFPDDNKLYNLAPGGQLVNGSGNTVASAPFKPTPPIVNNGYQLTLGPDGKYTAGQIPIGAQNGVGVDQTVSGAPAGGQKVSFNFAPGTPPEVIAAAKAEAQAAGDIPPSAQPQTLAQVIAAGKAKGGSDVIAQRAQQLQELKARGVTLTDDQRQAYLANGRLPSGSDAILAASMDTPLTPVALDESAVDFILQGPRGLPAYAYRDPVTAKQIQNHAGEMLQAAGLSPAMLPALRGSAKARESALVKMQAQGSMLARNIQSLDANVQMMLDAAQKVGNTNFKSWNALVLAAKGQVSDPAVAAYAQAVMNVLDDYGKVMSMSTTNQGTTDTQLRLAQQRISQAEGLPALKATADMIEAGGKNIRDKTDASIANLTNALQFGNLGSPTSVTTGAPGQQPAQPRAVNQQTGQAVVWNGTAWVPEQ